MCSTRNAGLVRSIGAAHVVDYTREDFTGGRVRHDVILDNVSSLPLSRLRTALAPKGTLVVNGRGCQARRHRRTDPGVTRRSRAISPVLSPRANRSAASSRNRSRRCCSAGAYPPRCLYLMPPSFASNRPASRPDLYEFILVSETITGVVAVPLAGRG